MKEYERIYELPYAGCVLIIDDLHQRLTMDFNEARDMYDIMRHLFELDKDRCLSLKESGDARLS